MSKIDQQGNEVRVGIAYQFVYGMPGPDVTTLVVTKIEGDEIEAFDVIFGFERLIVKADQLWRPLKHTWEAWKQDKELIIKHFGSSALSLE